MIRTTRATHLYVLARRCMQWNSMPVRNRHETWNITPLCNRQARCSIQTTGFGMETWGRIIARNVTYLSQRRLPRTEFQNRYYNTDIIMDIDPMKAVGHQLLHFSFSYTAKDAILYALGVGVSTTQEDYLKFLFERSDDFCILPSYGIIPAQKEVISSILEGKIPGLSNIDPAKVLHGEHYLEVYGAMPTANTLRNESVVVDVIDKRSGALVLFDVHTYDDGNNLVAYNQFSLFIVGAGGFGGKKNSDHEKPIVKPPLTPAEYTVTQATSLDQAALYRLSGDDNPLHIDPETAIKGGFPRPILHGLCTFGFALRHVLQKYVNNDVTKFKAIKVRFSKPVFPGQTLQTETWRKENRVYFQCKVTETNDIVISGAYVDFHNL